jgi:hypothetical protein
MTPRQRSRHRGAARILDAPWRPIDRSYVYSRKPKGVCGFEALAARGRCNANTCDLHTRVSTVTTVCDTRLSVDLLVIYDIALEPGEWFYSTRVLLS